MRNQVFTACVERAARTTVTVQQAEQITSGIFSVLGIPTEEESRPPVPVVDYEQLWTSLRSTLSQSGNEGLLAIVETMRQQERQATADASKEVNEWLATL